MITTKRDTVASISKPVISVHRYANARNTFVVKYKDGSTAYRLHKTDVLIFTSDNKMILNSGGYRTNTTKDRISMFLPQGWRISQINGLWYITTHAGVFDFYDGITFDLSTGKPKADKHVNVANINSMKEKIKKFVSKIDKLDKVPLPSSGDCWDCSFRTEDGTPMGDLSSSDHLLSHIKEGYLHGSLVYNALIDSGYTDRQIPYVFRMKEIVKRSLRKYLKKKLIKDLAH